jgi:hypothetical protein
MEKKDSKLLELRERFLQRQKAVEAAEKLISDLKTKLVVVKRQGSQFESDLEEGQREKDRVLSLVAIGQIGQNLLDRARDRLRKIEEGISDNREMVEAMEKGLKKAQEGLPKLYTGKDGSRHELFFYLTEQEVNKVRSTADLLVKRAWATACLSGGGSQYEYFLLSIFPSPPHDEIAGLEKEVQDEVGVKI